MSDEYEVFKEFMEETKQGLEILTKMWEIHEKKIGPTGPHRLGQQANQLRKEYLALLKRIDRLTKKFDSFPDSDFIKNDPDFNKGGDLRKKTEKKWRRGDKSKRKFRLMKGGRETGEVFTGRTPRKAAMKAATRGHSDIRLREHGTKKVHVFTGWTHMTNKPANAPKWLPDKIRKANVRKVRIDNLD